MRPVRQNVISATVTRLRTSTSGSASSSASASPASAKRVLVSVLASRGRQARELAEDVGALSDLETRLRECARRRGRQRCDFRPSPRLTTRERTERIGPRRAGLRGADRLLEQRRCLLPVARVEPVLGCGDAPSVDLRRQRPAASGRPRARRARPRPGRRRGPARASPPRRARLRSPRQGRWPRSPDGGRAPRDRRPDRRGGGGADASGAAACPRSRRVRAEGCVNRIRSPSSSRTRRWQASSMSVDGGGRQRLQQRDRRSAERGHGDERLAHLRRQRAQPFRDEGAQALGQEHVHAVGADRAVERARARPRARRTGSRPRPRARARAPAAAG